MNSQVFYLWDSGVKPTRDRDFGVMVEWDIPLLDGYSHEFVPNVSSDPGTHRFNGLNNPELVDRLAEWTPDAILMFGYRYRSHLRVLLSRRFVNVPLMLRGDSHDLARTSSGKSRLLRLSRTLIFRRFDAFLAVGKANAGYFRNSGAPESKIYFVPHCVDNARFEMAAKEPSLRSCWRRGVGINEAAKVVLFAGKLETKKRPLDLLEAFIAFEDPLRALDVVLLFVGSGALEQELRRRAGERVGRSVFFAPFQNQSGMPIVYAAGDVLVLPSMGVGETWGLAVNEAMSVGRPAVVSDHVGCGPDLIIEGVTGWTFPAGDVQRLGRLLVDVLAQPQKLAAAGAAAQQHIRKYSYEAATTNLLSALRTVVARSEAAP